MTAAKQDRSGAIALIVMGALIVGTSFTWGQYIHWVWPIGAVVMLVGALSWQMQRNLFIFHLLVTGILIALMVTRFTQINQVRTVTHQMSWKATGTTDNNEGRKANERIVELKFKDYPGHVQRLFSTDLANYLKAQYKDQDVKVRFAVTYDFKKPSKFRVLSVGERKVAFQKRSGAIEIFGSSGGKKPDAINSPWQFPSQ